MGLHHNDLNFQTNYSFPLDSGEELFVESASTLDVGQEITIFGLDENFNSKEVSVNLNGSNQIPLGGLWTRVFRMYNSGTSELNGDISVVDIDGDVFAYLMPENNQTLMALYTIPAEYTGYLMKFHCSAQNTSSSLICVLILIVDNEITNSVKAFGITRNNPILAIIIPRKIGFLEIENNPLVTNFVLFFSSIPILHELAICD